MAIALRVTTPPTVKAASTNPRTHNSLSRITVSVKRDARENQPSRRSERLQSPKSEYLMQEVEVEMRFIDDDLDRKSSCILSYAKRPTI